MWKTTSILFVILFVGGSPANGQLPKATATIPDGHVSIGSTLGGRYIITRPLKKKYDALISRTKTLKDQISHQTIDEETARRELKELQKELIEVTKQVEKTKQLVAVGKVHTRKQVTRMSLASGRLLIRAAKVRIVAWDKPHVEYVLEKIVLSVDGEGVDEDLNAIKVVQREGILPEDVGYTRQQNIDRFKGDAEELSPMWQRIAHESDRRFSPFNSVQGKSINVIQIEGLLYEQGNRQIAIELKGAHVSSSSQWRRHAHLTVYVPTCEWLGIRGGREGITVDSANSALGIVGDGDTDYDAKSRVSNVAGDLMSASIALHQIDHIGGNASIRHSEFHQNSSTHYSGNSRTTYTGTPSTLSYGDISGDLHLALTRADVNIQRLSGILDIDNDFGDTTFETPNLQAKGRHRLSSQAGNIVVRMPLKQLADNPMIAMTEAGVVKCTNAPRQVLQSRNVTTFTEPGPARRNWEGFTTDISMFELAARINAALTGIAGENGIDVISRGGRIDLEFSK